MLIFGPTNFDPPQKQIHNQTYTIKNQKCTLEKMSIWSHLFIRHCTVYFFLSNSSFSCSLWDWNIFQSFFSGYRITAIMLTSDLAKISPWRKNIVWLCHFHISLSTQNSRGQEWKKGFPFWDSSVGSNVMSLHWDIILTKT